MSESPFPKDWGRCRQLVRGRRCVLQVDQHAGLLCCPEVPPVPQCPARYGTFRCESQDGHHGMHRASADVRSGVVQWVTR